MASRRFVSLNVLVLGLLVCCTADAASPKKKPADENNVEDLARSAAQALNSQVRGFSVLHRGMDEARIRKVVRGAQFGEVLVVEPGASWVLKATLDVPAGVSIYGFTPGQSNNPTFTKGFDGPLMTIHSFVTLQGLVLDGNRQQFQGDGIVAGGQARSGVRELRLIRVLVHNNAGDGYRMTAPHYYSHFQFCKFDHNGGYGIVYGQVRSHHTDNLWENCHYGWNDKGGVAFFGVEADSIWENCEWFHNGGPAFDHFLVSKKTGDGKEIGEMPEVGAEVLTIRSCIFRQCAGPVWLERGGMSQSIVFEDCRMKHNGDPKESDPTKDLGKTVEQLFNLTPPVAGVFHVEEGQLCIELRGGFAYDNGPYLFTASPKATEGCRILLSGSSKIGFSGGIHNPNGYATILDRSLLPSESPIVVKSGIALDPTTGQVLKLGTNP